MMQGMTGIIKELTRQYERIHRPRTKSRQILREVPDVTDAAAADAATVCDDLIDPVSRSFLLSNGDIFSLAYYYI